MHDARSEPRPVEADAAKEKEPTVEKATESSGRASKETRESAYDRLALDKLTIEREAPKKPAPEKQAPAPEVPKQAPAKEPERRVRAGAASVSVLPGPARKSTTQKAAPQKAPARKAPPQKAPVRKAPMQKAAPKARPPVVPDGAKPHDTRLLLSIPRLGIENVTVGDSPEQSYLNREGIMHLSETGFPYERGSNTYIVGHAADYDTSRIPNVFRNLKTLKQGDLITLRDALGRTYNYRAYQYLIVNPRDIWVTDPLPGREIVSLQTCFPDPTFHKRLIIRAERVR
jgi:sortase A